MKAISGCTEISRMAGISVQRRNLLLSPLVLTTDLILFLRGEIVLDVECLTDLFWGLALDHIRNGLAPDIQQSLDVKVVGSLRKNRVSLRSPCRMLKTTYKDNLKQHLLVYLHKLLIPLLNICSLLPRVGIIIVRCLRIGLVVGAPLKNLVQHCLVDLAWRSEFKARVRR